MPPKSRKSERHFSLQDGTTNRRPSVEGYTSPHQQFSGNFSSVNNAVPSSRTKAAEGCPRRKIKSSFAKAANGGWSRSAIGASFLQPVSNLLISTCPVTHPGHSFPSDAVSRSQAGIKGVPDTSGNLRRTERVVNTRARSPCIATRGQPDRHPAGRQRMGGTRRRDAGHAPWPQRIAG